jgi:molybdopterin-guanine dinucleotide biosynthesis protein A
MSTNPPSDVTGIVLAGGRSTRFGADKLAIDIDGRSVLDRAVGAVASVAADVMVVGPVGPVGPVGSRPGVRIVDDPDPFGGPLQALAGALAQAATEIAIVVAGDMPSLERLVLELLVEQLRSQPALDAVVLADPGDPARRQPVPLAIRAEPARAAAAEGLEAGDRSLVRLLGRLATAELPADRWLPLDPEARTLIDIDVPADLDRLRDGAADQRMR